MTEDREDEKASLYILYLITFQRKFVEVSMPSLKSGSPGYSKDTSKYSSFSVSAFNPDGERVHLPQQDLITSTLIYFLNSHRYCHKSISSFNYLIKRSIGLQNIMATLTTNVVSQFKTLEVLLLVQLLDTIEFGKLRKIILQKQEDYPTTFLRYWIHLYTKWFMSLRLGKVLNLVYLAEVAHKTGFFYSMWAPNHYIIVDEEKKLRDIHFIKEGSIAFKWEVFSMDEYDFGGNYAPELLKKPATEPPRARDTR
jgi:hypothetical protein